MTSDRRFGAPVPDWTPPPWPGPDAAGGPLPAPRSAGAALTPTLFAANRVDDAIWDYLPTAPSPTSPPIRDWVVRAAGKPDPLFFALIDRAAAPRAGVASLMRITPDPGSIEVGHISPPPPRCSRRAPRAR